MPALIGLSQNSMFDDYSGISFLTCRTNNANNNHVLDGADYIIPEFASNMDYNLAGNGLIMPDRKKLQIEINKACRSFFAIATMTLTLPAGSTMTNMYALMQLLSYDPDTQTGTPSSLGRARISGISDNYMHHISIMGCYGEYSQVKEGQRLFVEPVVQAGVKVSDVQFTVVSFV